MYVTEVPNRGGKPTVLLRESYREQGKVKSRTLANLTNLPAHLLDAVKRDDEGRPVAVSVYEGNTHDAKTVPDQVRALRERFNIDLVVFVGDRGMITEAHIDRFKETHTEDAGIEWITALKSGAIQKLKAQGSLQLGLFDEKNLFAFSSPEYPGERLVACRNPELQKRRARKRLELIAATKRELDKIQETVRCGRLSGKAEIGLRIGRVINKYKVAKHFKVEIETSSFHYRVRPEAVAQEAALDGIYVVRTSVPAEVMKSADVVRCYKRLTRVERAFRSMKTVDLKVRPVYHRLSDRVRAHIFLCMLAYYVEWHLRRVWAPLLFDDEVDRSWTRDAVAKAEVSTLAQKKKRTKRTADGLTVNSFQSLLASLSSIVKNECRRQGASSTEPHFEMTTRADPLQTRALALIDTVPNLWAALSTRNQPISSKNQGVVAPEAGELQIRTGSPSPLVRVNAPGARPLSG